MTGPNDDPRQKRNAPEGDVERPIEGSEARESEEVTDANIAMNEEFIDAGNEAHLEEDAGIDDQPGDGGPQDDVDTIINSGIVGRSAG